MMTLDDARFVAATHIRELEALAEGQELTHMGGRPMTNDEKAAWARMNAEAIRQVIQAAGLSDVRHPNPDAEGDG